MRITLAWIVLAAIASAANGQEQIQFTTERWLDRSTGFAVDFEMRNSPKSQLLFRGQDSGSGSAGEGGGDLSAQATNPTSDLTVLQVQNTFVPNTYGASGYANILGLQAVKPFKTGCDFFPIWVTRTTLPVVTTADPDGAIPIGPPNDTESSVPLSNQAGLGDLVFISIFNHPTSWGSWGIGPGFVAPTATRFEL